MSDSAEYLADAADARAVSRPTDLLHGPAPVRDADPARDLNLSPNPPPAPTTSAAPLTALAWAQHGLFVLLAVIGAVRAATSGEAGPVPVAGPLGAALLLAWYAAGARLPRRLWLGGAVLGWLALTALSADFLWLAFPLYFLALHLLGRRPALLAVAGLAAAATAGYSWHAGALSVAGFLGPFTGAAVATVLALVQQAFFAESEQRRRLLAELIETQAQLAAREREAGVLAERERLAREIHDTVAQGLSSIVLLLRAAEDTRHSDPVAARAHLVTASAEARANLEETRRFVRALAPAALDGRPLTDALTRLAAALPGRDSGFAVDGEPCPLPTAIEVALLRVAQGALANVRTHAGASTVRMTLAFQPDAVALDVADDGCGFDPAASDPAPTAGTGFGLAAMRTRLAEVHGTLVVESAPGEGTALAARVPLPAARQGGTE